MAAALALLTSVAYGLSNYVGPRLARDAPLFVVLIAGQVCSALLAMVVIGVRAEGVPGGGPVLAALLAGLGNAAGLLLFYRAAAIGPLSIVTPIGALGAAVPVANGIGEGEAVTVLEAAGMALALGGLALVVRRPAPAPGGGTDGAEPAGDRRRAVVLAVAAAACFGVFLAAMGPASQGGSGWAVLLSRVSLLALLGAAAWRAGASLRLAPRRLPLLAVPGTLLFAGTLAYSVATRVGDLSVVSVLGSLHPVVTVALALGLDRERLRPVQLAGVVGVIGGVVVLSAR